MVEGNSIRYVRFMDDFPVFPLSNVWTDVGGIQSRTEGKLYAVQTAPEVIQRCILMTTDPGDLVFDPTCGSGSTAYCAEKSGTKLDHMRHVPCVNQRRAASGCSPHQHSRITKRAMGTFQADSSAELSTRNAQAVSHMTWSLKK